MVVIDKNLAPCCSFIAAPFGTYLELLTLQLGESYTYDFILAGSF